MKKSLFLAAAVLVAPAAAHADSIVDQIERLDVERGEHEWELQNVYAQAVGGDPSVLAMNYSGEFGLRDWLALGFELETGKEGAEGIDADLLALQAKFVALDPGEAPIGLGAQISVGRALHGNETEAELRLLAETRFAGLVFASDVTLENAITGDEAHDTVLRYAARVDWPRDWGVIAVEMGGELGELDDARFSADDRHWIGPEVTLQIGELAIDVGYFAGLTETTPDAQFRVQMALR